MKKLMILTAMIGASISVMAQTTVKPAGVVSVTMGLFKNPTTDSVYIEVQGSPKRYYNLGIFGKINQALADSLAGVNANIAGKANLAGGNNYTGGNQALTDYQYTTITSEEGASWKTFTGNGIIQSEYKPAGSAYSTQVGLVGQIGLVLGTKTDGSSGTAYLKADNLTALRDIQLPDASTTLVGNNGVGATGTWGINITGNAATATNSTQWGGNTINLSSGATVIDAPLVLEGGITKYASKALFKAYLDIPSGGINLQTVTDEGSITTNEITAGASISSVAEVDPKFNLYSTDLDSENRNWQIVSNADAFGDFDIRHSAARGGSPIISALKINSNGNTTFSGNVTAPNFIGDLTGNASKWATATADFSTPISSAPDYVMGFTSGVAKPFNSTALKTFLGLGSNAYTSTAYLPYTGATGNVDLGVYNLTAGKLTGTDIDIKAYSEINEDTSRFYYNGYSFVMSSPLGGSGNLEAETIYSKSFLGISGSFTEFSVGNPPVSGQDVVRLGDAVQAPTPSTIPLRTSDGYLAAETAPEGSNNTLVANTAYVQRAVPTMITFTASGDGTNPSFSVAHGLSSPTMVMVTPNSADAAFLFGGTSFYAAIVGSNVTITYDNPPTAGTNNLKWTILVK